MPLPENPCVSSIWTPSCITRDEFLQQSEASYQQEFLVEQQLDWLEDMLEVMGYDD